MHNARNITENKLVSTTLSGGTRDNDQSVSLKSAGNVPSNMAFITDSLTKLKCSRHFCNSKNKQTLYNISW